jgi:hypothetical protein
MVPIEYDAQNGTPTTLRPFFQHWISMFSVILAFGFSLYAFSVPLGWKMFVSTLLSLQVLSMVIVIPAYYGPRVVPAAVGKQQISRNGSKDTADDCEFQTLLPKPEVADDDDQAFAAANDVCFYGSSVPLSVSIRTWRFWVIYCTFLVLCGTALMVIDDINMIAAALGTSPSTFFVTCVSLANGLGRVSAGYTSDLLVHKFSRLQMMSFVAIFMALAQGLFAIGSSYLLYPCLLVVGYLFGCTVALIAVTVPDVFGGKYVATNFGAVDSAPIFGSYVFVTGVVAIFYYTNTVDDAGGDSCVGSHCFRAPFIVNACCCLLMGIIMYITHLHTPITIRASSH